MIPLTNTTYLLIGGIIGFTSSTLGAIIDYSIAPRRENSEEEHLPGCMLLVSGTLGLIGLVVTLISFFLTKGFRPAVMTGIGVLAGFTIAFIVLIIAWFITADRETQQEISILE